jgi:hypothetical protein
MNEEETGLLKEYLSELEADEGKKEQ